MRMGILAALAAGLVAGCGPAPEVAPDALPQSDLQEITAQVDSTVASLYEAMNAHDDERVMAHYLPTDDFLYVGVSDAVQGWQAFSSIMAPWYRAHPDVVFEYQVMHIQVLSRGTATVTVRGSSTEAPHLMWTRTLVNHEGQWRIALEHESWPGGEAPSGNHPGT